MIEKIYLCVRCDVRFPAQVLEPGERPDGVVVPLRCPDCKGTSIIDPKKVS